MNNISLIGRLTDSPVAKVTSTGQSVSTFTLAVPRDFKNKDGERDADFIRIVAWRQKADFCNKYLVKGQQCGVIGRLQVRTYDDKDGIRRTIAEVVLDEINPLSKPKEAGDIGDVNTYATSPALTTSTALYQDDDDVPF